MKKHVRPRPVSGNPTGYDFEIYVESEDTDNDFPVIAFTLSGETATGAITKSEAKKAAKFFAQLVEYIK